MYARRKLTLVCLAILFVLNALAFQPSPASTMAELVFLVDSTNDLPDYAGNSVCSALDISGGPCTLRAAIYEANVNIHYTDVTILVPPGIYTLTILPEETEEHRNGDLDILTTDSTNLITIKSTGAPGDVVITTANDFHDRILEIGVANVSISDITFSEANFLKVPLDDGGGAINNYGTLSLEGVKFVNNTVSCMPGLDCANSVVGGAIRNQGTLTIDDSSFIQNSADRGSAIFNAGGENLIDISHSTFTQNTTSTIANWSGIFILNSTFSEGRQGITNDGILLLYSNTLVNFSETIRNGADKYIHAANNIFMTHAPKIFAFSFGIWESGGYNIFSDNSWPGTYATGDLSNTNPRLGILGSYGGPTLTYPLQEGSPAIDHRPEKCFSTFRPIDEDQRYVLRDDGYCDTGAFEHSGHFYPMHYLPFIRK